MMETDGLQSRFVELLQKRDIHITENQLNQFETYYRELVVWNANMNLTGITKREEVYIKHFYDSSSLAFFIPFGKISSLADIGSGAGFPGIPLKILYPHIKLVIVDSLNKRIQFLEHLVQALKLSDVNCVHGRAEDIGLLPQYRDSFDLVTARAVARLNILNELCLPFAKVGGFFASMKGADPAEEINEAEFSACQLNSRLFKVSFVELPGDQSKRHLVIYEKLKATPKKYPRKAGIPSKNPLRA